MKLNKISCGLSLIIAIIFCAMILLYGVIPNQYDNLFYLNSARNIFYLKKYINGFNLIDPQWPIFYSLSLVPAFFLHIPEHIFARILNLGYFFGGVYFFYQFLKIRKIESKILLTTIAFCLVNYYTIRSVLLEMPDITFYFYFNAFLYIVENAKLKRFNTFLFIGLISFFAVITKPTGSVFFLACFAGLILSTIQLKKFDLNSFYITLSTLFGAGLGKLINKLVIEGEQRNGAILHLQHLHVDGGVKNSKEMIASMLEQVINFDLFKEKVIFLSNWFISSDVFRQFQFVPFMMGLFLIFIFLKYIYQEIFRNGKFSKLSIAVLVIYFVLCLTPAPVIQKRHVIPMIPFLYFIFTNSVFNFEFIRNNEWVKKLVFSFVVVGNILPVVLLLSIGNLKDHGGIYHQIFEKKFYMAEFVDIYEVAHWTKSFKEKNIYVPIKLVRFFSYQRNGQVRQLLENSSFEKGDLVVKYRNNLENEKIENMSSIYSNPTFEVFEIIN